MELETANSIDRNMDSSSPKGSPSSQSDNDSEKDPSQKDKRSPKSEKGSNKNEAPSPKSSSSSDGSGSVQSPPSKTPPSPLPSSSPLTTPSTQPPLSSRSPKESPPTKLQSSPPPPPYLLLLPPPLPSPSSSSPPLSSPPPLPSSGKDDNSSHNPPKQSPPPSSEAPSPSVTPSSSQTPNNSSSRNSPPPSTVTPLGSSSPSQSHNSPPALRRGDQATNSISNHPSPPYSPSLSIGSQPRSRGFSNDSLPSTSGRGDSDNSSPVKYVSIALVGVCIIALVAICLLVAIMRKRKRGAVYDVSYMPPLMKAGVDGHYYGQQPLQESHYKNASQNGTMHPLGASESAKPKSAQTGFSYERIMEITNGFSIQNIIGEGGFGCVYKGWLTDGRVVAVKKLKADSGQGEREFRAEVEIISRVHHRHLVSLVGYCISERHKILMYEFVPNGTLDHHLHGKGMPVLDWTKRVKIAIGAAKGLAYLHEDCNPKIIHRDIKSANILLDDAYVAQVSDFGLARLTDDANTHVSTRVMGTFGYMAPEYATSGKLTDRSDVFSFGVVLLELLTGRKPVDQTQPLGEESLVEWARPLLIHAVETGDFSKLIDPKLERQFVESEMLRMIEAATACVRHSAPKRPRMLQVARALDSEGELVDLSNGVKYGQSTIYNSGQYDEEIMRFRMMNGCSFGNSEFDMYSAEYSSRELSGFQRAWVQDGSVVESKSIAFNRHGSRHMKEHR